VGGGAALLRGGARGEGGTGGAPGAARAGTTGGNTSGRHRRAQIRAADARNRGEGGCKGEGGQRQGVAKRNDAHEGRGLHLNVSNQILVLK
jgi:hypothetical protein